MKKSVMIVFCILLLSGFVSAISTDLKANYDRGETIIAEIKGNILEPITKEQVDFIRGHVSVPFDYDLKKLGEKYFLWASAPTNENNYTLVIKDIVTTENGKTTKINFEQNFSVAGNFSDYNIKPGFIFTREDFSVDIYFNEDSENKINAGFPSREIILKPGKNTIEFSIEEANETGLYMIEIGKYAFPAYIFVEEVNGRQIGKKPMLRFEPERIASIMLIGEKSAYPFQIVNFGDWDVGDIEIDYDENIFSIDRETIGLKAKEGIELNASFIGDISEEMKIKGISRIITARAGGYAFELPVVINFTEKQEEAKTPYLNNYTRLSYCSELKGKVCVAEENCTGETKTSLDGACCVGACAKKEIESGNYSWIGWLIAGIVLLVIIYAYLRYKKAKGTDKFAEITGS